MSRPNASAERVGLALVDAPGYDSDLLEALHEANVRVTFFVRPDVLILETTRWRFVRAAGHELGDACLLGATDDGRLANWTCAAIDAEMRESMRLLRDLGQDPVCSVYLPGRFHLCAEGRYRRKVQESFAVCVGDSERSRSVQGVRGIPAARSIATIAAGVTELRRFLASIGTHAVVHPLCELVPLSPHT